MPDSTERLTKLRALLAAREGRNEYRDSLPLIRAEIEMLEARAADA